jgi:uncharacterized protein YacL
VNEWLMKAAVLLLSSGGGMLLARGADFASPIAVGFAGGLLAGVIALLAERLVRRIESGTLAGGIIGLALGLAAAHLLGRSLAAGALDERIKVYIPYFLSVVLGYLGLVVGSRKGFSLPAREPVVVEAPAAPEPEFGRAPKVLDTSVIIDGRIADICETGFLDGVFIIPQFVLRELQHIADSSDTLKRNRGRRGLDILHRLQKKADLDLRIVETDFPRIREVDAKLIALAKQIGGRIITNDFNLNKVAELQGVTVLNINQLANALKPVVLPGELMKVYILKEGKEANQGVAYLDDGTMVVVDNAKREIGKNVDVLVTSVLQTTAGRMIFTQIKDDQGRNGS